MYIYIHVIYCICKHKKNIKCMKTYKCETRVCEKYIFSFLRSRKISIRQKIHLLKVLHLYTFLHFRQNAQESITNVHTHALHCVKCTTICIMCVESI